MRISIDFPLKNERARAVALALGMVMVAIVAFKPAMEAGFIWDDDQYVTENAHLGSLEGLRKIWTELKSTPQYYPMVFSSFWLEHRLWDLEPAGYHVVNILLHSGCAFLLWMLLRRLGLAAALPAALLFLVHPVHVESVAWVTERKNVLSGVFYLASAIMMVRFFGLHATQGAAGNGCAEGASRGESTLRALSVLRAPYIWGLILFMCALLSKTVTCSLPAALVLVIWWKRGAVTRRELLLLAPFFALGLASGLLTAWLERSHVGAEGIEWSYSLVERCLIAGRVLWFYAGKLAWPAVLVFNYPRWHIDAGDPLQYLYPLGILAVLAGLWVQRHRWGRGPLVGVLFFCGTLFPALGFIDVYPFRFSFVADHFQYLASIGILTVAAGAALHFGEKMLGWAKLPALAFGLLLLILLGWQTNRQCLIYANIETLWRDTIARNPASWLAHNNLANHLARTGRMEEAIHHHRQALQYRPDPEVSHNNLADTLAKQGRIEEAEHHYKEALRLNPRYAPAYLNYGFLKESRGETLAARRFYEEAIRLRPDYPEVHVNLGLIKEAAGDLEDALRHYRQALQARPDYAEARQAMGRLLARRGELPAAISQFEEVLRLDPGSEEAHFNLALALIKAGRIDEAMHHLSETIRLNPRLPEAHHQAGLATARAGKLADAEQHFTDALALSPGHAGARLNLALVLGLQGRLHDSLDHLEEAVRLSPDSPQPRMRLAQTLWLIGRREAARAEQKRLETLDRASALELDNWIQANALGQEP